MSTRGYYTTDLLIEQIKRKAMIPQNQQTFTQDDFLAFANEELKLGIVPSVQAVHEEFYVFRQVVPLVPNKSSYEIPYRATGGKLRDVMYQDPNGNLLEMTRISPDDKALYQYSKVGTRFLFFYVENNNIILTPQVTDSPQGSLLFTYFIRPSDLVAESRVAVVTNIATDTNAGTTTYTVDGIPEGFSTNVKLDLLQAKPGHKIRKIDVTPAAISLNNRTITFNTADADSGMEVGDHIAFAGECIIPQCPSDLHPMLAQRCAARCLEALSDTQGLNNANTKLQEMEMKAMELIDNRVDGAPQKVANTKGLLRNSKIRRRWWL